MKRILCILFILIISPNLNAMLQNQSQKETTNSSAPNNNNDNNKSPIYSIAATDNLFAYGRANGKIIIRSMEGKCLKKFYGHQSTVYSLTFVTKGNSVLLISGDTNGIIKIWNLSDNDSNKWTCRATIQNAHKGTINHLAPTLGNEYFISTSTEIARLWYVNHENPHLFKNIATLKSNAPIASAAIHRKNISLFFLGCHWNNPIKKCLLPEEKTKDTSLKNGNIVYALGVSTNGKLLASGSEKGHIKIFDLENDKCIGLCNGHDGAIYSVLFTNDNKYLISCSADKTVKIWNWASGKCLYTFSDAKDQVFCTTLTPNEKFIIYCTNDGILKKRKNPLCMDEIN